MTTEKRLFELVDDRSNKFWEVWTEGVRLCTRYGKIGSAGQTTTKDDSSGDAATRALEKLVKEKTGKGYVEKSSRAKTPPEEKPAVGTKTAVPKADAGGEALPAWVKGPWGYATADFDASDAYVFTLSLDGKGRLSVRYESTGGAGGFEVSKAALERGKRWIQIAQGGASDDDEGLSPGDVADKAVPPFLLPRAIFASLKSGKTVSWPSAWGEDDDLELAGRAKMSVTHGKSTHTFDVCKIAGSEVSLWVVDDANWPLVLVHDECGGDNYWRAVAMGPGLEPKSVAALDDAAEHSEPELVVEPAKKTPTQAAKATATQAKGASAGSAELKLLALKSTPPKKLLEAIAVVETLSDDASRDALFALLSHPKFDVIQRASSALGKRCKQPGMADAMVARLSAISAKVPPDDGDGHSYAGPPSLRLASRLLHALRPESLEHAPLRELLRNIARTHSSGHLRAGTRSVLILANLGDEGFQKELAGRITETKTLLADASLRGDVVTCVVYTRPADEAGPLLLALIKSLPIEAQEDTIRQLGHGLDASWIPVLLDWWKQFEEPAPRQALARKLEDLPWSALGNLSDPAHFERLCNLYDLFHEDADRVARSIDMVLSDAETPEQLKRLSALATKMASSSSIGPLDTLIGERSAELMVPALLEVVREAKNPDVFPLLAYRLEGVDTSEYRAVLTELLTRMKAAHEPDTDRDYSGTIEELSARLA